MEIINKEWCEQHGMEMPYANVARDTSYCLVKDGYYIVIYTESTTGEKKLFVQNRTIKKSIEMEMPKYDFKLDKHNDFTTDDLKKMCDMIVLDGFILHTTTLGMCIDLSIQKNTTILTKKPFPKG